MAGTGVERSSGAGHADPLAEGRGRIGSSDESADGSSDALARVARFTQEQLAAVRPTPLRGTGEPSSAAGTAPPRGSGDVSMTSTADAEVATVERPQDCSACGACERVCPVAAITLDRERADALEPPVVVDLGECTGCGACVRACPQDVLGLRPAPSTAALGPASPSGG